MASWLWRRLRGKRRPLTGFCFFLALSMAALSRFNPGLSGHNPQGPAESPRWVGRPRRAVEGIPPGGPQSMSARQDQKMATNSSSVCKDDRGPRGRAVRQGGAGHSHPSLDESSRQQGWTRRDAANAASVTTSRRDSRAISQLGMTRTILLGRQAARRAKGPRVWHGDHLRELPIKKVSPGDHLEEGINQMASPAGKPSITSLLEDLGPGRSRPSLHHPDVQAPGPGKEEQGLGSKEQAGFIAQAQAASLWPGSVEELRGSVWCDAGMTGKGGRLEANEIPPWFTKEDVWKMRLLAHGEVMGRARVPGHGQVLQVGLSGEGIQNAPGPDLSPLCSKGLCGLIKRPQDLYEVLAFHLDRVLGLYRSLPVVARYFQSPLLPYRYTRGEPHPVVWWAPDVWHLNDTDNDQNSFALGWLQYQALLRLRCGMADSGALLGEAPCLSIHHTEWARLALFDFLLQVHDRLDRYCCGFQPEPSDPCLEERLREKCRNPGELLLVHILVRESNPSHLVYIDNAGKPLHPEAQLNFRLLEGIDGFPESAVNVLASGCLERMLLKSLQMDPKFWDSQGGHQGLKPLLGTIERRGQILLDYIRRHNLILFREEAQGKDQNPLT